MLKKTHLNWCLFVFLICLSQIRTSSSLCTGNWLCKSIFNHSTFESTTALNAISNLIDNFSDDLQYVERSSKDNYKDANVNENKNVMRDNFDDVKYELHETSDRYKDVRYVHEKIDDFKNENSDHFINDNINNINENIFKNINKPIADENEQSFTNPADVLSPSDGIDFVFYLNFN